MEYLRRRGSFSLLMIVNKGKRYFEHAYKKVRGISDVSAGVGVFREGKHPLQWVKDFQGQNQTAVQNIIEDISKAHRVRIQVTPVFGFYKGDPEPAYILKLTGVMKHTLGAAADWGKGHNQHEVRIIFRYDSAEGFRYVFQFKTPLSDKKKIDTLTERISDELLSASLIRTNKEQLEIGEVQYWGKSIEGENAEDEALLLRDVIADVVGFNNIVDPPPKYGFQVLDIREGEYYWYIRESASERNIKNGKYWDDYSSS